KVLDDDGGGMATHLAKGIRLAIEQGAQIILLSLGDSIYSDELADAVQLAEQEGVMVIAASGNDASRVTYPGTFSTVLAVGAIDDEGRILSYSNGGPELDLVALGDHIQTTDLNGGYTERSGTSFA